ncbi:hypothetical protein NPS70_16255 [Streptomyces sp. C10-9-1]|uniref:hypothetical protein n=1 Tax=Streptomyces sp. C10-9-1 TaxID=1859285 RepID=UPI002111AC77|nr:hypothetical protein [Streptomyces sp. C10-9-1]MCQ6554739.1 hypothetical protein [Streptomyces sp. C10-9-1]
MQNQHLWGALAAVLNALREAGEDPVPMTSKGFSTITGTHGSVDADRSSDAWIVVMKPED